MPDNLLRSQPLTAERILHLSLTLCIVQLEVSHETQLTGGLEESHSIPSVSIWILWQQVQFELRLEYLSLGKEMSGNAVSLRPSEVCQIWLKLNRKFESY